jgi:hypothetical protein
LGGFVLSFGMGIPREPIEREAHDFGRVAPLFR